MLSLFSSSVAAYGGQAFLEDGKEYVYDAELYQNAGTMDYSPSAAATAWKYTIRMQVAGDDINFRVTDATGSQYVGPWSSSGWAWDQTTFTPIPAGDEFSITYKNGQAVSLKVPSSYDTHRKNLVKAFATTWQIKLEDKDYFVAQEVITSLVKLPFVANHVFRTCCMVTARSSTLSTTT